MLCIISPSNDPYFNLASEEYLLKNIQEDVFLLYINRPSIVVGKHQNTLAEINYNFVQEKGITVARRISGGGTVFHDLGNLNFAFISSGKEGALVDYRKHTSPIIEALGTMGLDVRLGKRNELMLGDKKISGTASHVYKRRVLHHGTLLFSSTMRDLSNALKVEPDKFNDRSVKSVRSSVTNIQDHLVDKMDLTGFQNRILGHIFNTNDLATSYSYNGQDMKEIQKLHDSKFSTWEWNFGYSPRYEFSRTIKLKTGTVGLQMNVEKGIIQEVHFEGEFISPKDIHTLEDVLVGTIHDPATLRKRLSGIQVEDYITGLGNEELLSGMF